VHVLSQTTSAPLQIVRPLSGDRLHGLSCKGDMLVCVDEGKHKVHVFKLLNGITAEDEDGLDVDGLSTNAFGVDMELLPHQCPNLEALDLLERCFATWVQVPAEERRTKDKARAIIKRIQNRTMYLVLDGWSRVVNETRAALRRAIVQWISLQLVTAFAMWIDKIDADIEREEWEAHLEEVADHGYRRIYQLRGFSHGCARHTSPSRPPT